VDGISGRHEAFIPALSAAQGKSWKVRVQIWAQVSKILELCRLAAEKARCRESDPPRRLAAEKAARRESGPLESRPLRKRAAKKARRRESPPPTATDTAPMIMARRKLAAEKGAPLNRRQCRAPRMFRAARRRISDGASPALWFRSPKNESDCREGAQQQKPPAAHFQPSPPARHQAHPARPLMKKMPPSDAKN
jgi:hypothetical protein